MIGKISVIQDDHKAIFIQFDEKCKFKMNELVNISSKRKQRTLPQNSLYWCLLTWMMHPRGGDLRSQGYYSVDALHENIKGYIEEVHPHQFNVYKKFSTTNLTKEEFGEFLEIINLEFFIEKLHVDTSGFWIEYEKFSKWVDYNSPDFKTFMDEKASNKMPF